MWNEIMCNEYTFHLNRNYRDIIAWSQLLILKWSQKAQGWAGSEFNVNKSETCHLVWQLQHSWEQTCYSGHTWVRKQTTRSHRSGQTATTPHRSQWLQGLSVFGPIRFQGRFLAWRNMRTLSELGRSAADKSFRSAFTLYDWLKQPL